MTDPTPCRPPGPHPSAEELYRARQEARQGPRSAETEAVLAHAMACAACSEELLRQEAFDQPQPLSAAKLTGEWERFQQALQREAAAPDAPALRPAARQVVPFRRRPLLRRPAFALAAALAAVVLGLAVWVALQPGPGSQGLDPEDELRGGKPATGEFSPAGTLDAPPAEFVFPAPDALPRRVLLFDPAGTYRWTSEPAAGGRVSLPESERQQLHPGVEYFWTVLADDGGSPAQSFEIQPPS